MNQMKILYVSTISNTINAFLIPHIKFLIKEGHNVDIACNVQRELPPWLAEWRCRIFNIEFSRSPLSWSNISAYRKLRSLICNEKYDLVHTHTPIASVWTRLACRDLRDVKVIYTAHGFHFYKGAPLKNWLVYYPIERYLSRFTDVLITINKEDYSRAKKYFRAGRIEYIPGVGLDIGKFRDVVIDRAAKRKEIGVPEDAFVLVSVGELNRNKNHEVIVKALAKLKNKRIYYVICGSGPLEKYLKNLITELCLGRHVKLLGYRADIPDILKAADVFAFPSKREGLGLAALEAMASGLPIITSNVHGIVDYSISGITGFTCKPTDIQGFANAIDVLLKDESLRFRMGAHNQEVVQRFELKKALLLMKKIYRKELLQ